LPTSSEAVGVRELYKTFELGEIASLKLTVERLARSLRRDHRATDRFEALHDVSFDVASGECFTIVGTNGSGKSTLIKCITGITLPTRGRVEVHGRVLPLLSVASALELELTGRENVHLFGTILGLPGEEIGDAVPRVAEFAGIDAAHMETPIKRYSEGMKARLAFSIGLRLPADVYVFDEVLTHADEEFKAACVLEIERLVSRGRTVIFVSHELQLVRSVCTRGMWLHDGRIKALGPIDKVVGAYAEFESAVADRA
jgi:ABC-type polysaccharide/polyol phosphate transport system ATPase subunit